MLDPVFDLSEVPFMQTVVITVKCKYQKFYCKHFFPTNILIFSAICVHFLFYSFILLPGICSQTVGALIFDLCPLHLYKDTIHIHLKRCKLSLFLNYLPLLLVYIVTDIAPVICELSGNLLALFSSIILHTASVYHNIQSLSPENFLCFIFLFCFFLPKSLNCLFS